MNTNQFFTLKHTFHFIFCLIQDFGSDDIKTEGEKSDSDNKNNGSKFKQLERTNSDEDNKTFHDGRKKNPKVRDEDRMFVNLGLIDLVNVKNDALMKIIKPR